MTATDERIVKAYYDLAAQGRDLDYLEDQSHKIDDELKRGIRVLCDMNDELTVALYEGGHTNKDSAKMIDGAFYWANYESPGKLKMSIAHPDEEEDAFIHSIPTESAFARGVG